MAVQEALTAYPDSSRIVLIGHSIGGWISRAWLSEWCRDESIKSKVRVLLTLGSPHSPPPSDSAVASLDQTRGLLTYINANFPGAHESGVEYISVGGTAVQGALPNTDIDTDKSIVSKLESAVAFASYLFLCGEGTAVGDGIIPLSTSQLPGAQSIQIEVSLMILV